MYCHIDFLICTLYIIYYLFFSTLIHTRISSLSLHDALPISDPDNPTLNAVLVSGPAHATSFTLDANGSFSYVQDRKSTRLNSSHLVISYAVFCLKKKKIIVSTYN